MKKRLLILNGSWGEVPLIKAAKELGFHVITSGNKPQAFGHQFADEYICGNYSNLDEMVQVAKDCKADAICAAANDLGGITAAYVGEKLGLKGHDSYETCLLLHHKDKFKRFARENNIMTPLAEEFTSREEAKAWAKTAKYPIIVKPVDMFSGVGINRANNYEEAVSAIDIAFESGRKPLIVIEPFIVGTSHSFSTFLVDQEVIAYYSDNEYSTLNPYWISLSAAPADGIEYCRDILIEQSNKIAKLLNLCDGVFHIQYIMDEDHKPHILEITRRCSGGHFPDQIECANGIPWAKWIITAESGMDCSNLKQPFSQDRHTGRYCILAPKNGTVKAVHIKDEMKKHIFRCLIWGDNGYVVTDHMHDTLGVFSFTFDDRAEMMDMIMRMEDFVTVEYED